MRRPDPLWVDVGVGVLGAAVTFLASVLLTVVPDSLPAAVAEPYVRTLYRPLLALQWGVLVVGVPLLSAGLAAWLAVRGESTRDVLFGFLVGSVVLAGGLSAVAPLLGALTAGPAVRTPVLNVPFLAVAGGTVVAGAVVGLVAAALAGEGASEHLRYLP
jgi:hypothetical protein